MIPSTARQVFVATGRDRVPHIPHWPGATDTSLTVLHSSDFRAASGFTGHNVMLVGGGNSGSEIAHLLADYASSSRSRSETRPMFVRRETLGVSITQVGRPAKQVPQPILDPGAKALQRLQMGNLSKLGLGPPEMVLEDDLGHTQGPSVDAGFIDAVRSGSIAVVGEIDHFTDTEAVLTDGARLEPDTVIATTGYGPDSRPSYPRTTLDADRWPLATEPPYQAAPGLFFAGFAPATPTSFMPDFVEHLPTIAEAIAASASR